MTARLVLREYLSDKRFMSSAANVAIHPSQFPENVRRDLWASLRTRRVNHKFHYDSVKQTQKWLALHQAYSPARHDPDCQAIYDRAFKAAAVKIKSKAIHVIGLGCGGGQKDTRLLKWLKKGGREIFYTPCDVSIAMVLVARRTALAVMPDKNCSPFVCDLATANDLSHFLVTRHPRIAAWPPRGFTPSLACRAEASERRLVTFFGMIPNFEPQLILPKLVSLVRPKDFLLFSANLAPGKDYAAGVKKVLPQYDNPPTRDWLMTFLDDLGVGREDGRLQFKIETCSSRGNEAPTEKFTVHCPQSTDDQKLLTSSPAAERIELKRIVAGFHFTCSRRIEVDGKQFDFRAGETIRLFFSYRYTPDRVRQVLAGYGLEVCEQWITRSAEEGVFLVRRSGVSAERR